MTVFRFDAGRLDAPVRTPQGFLRVTAAIARTGVQTYMNVDGSKRVEYRPPEEVFHADALASFALAPVTLQHPPEPVTKDNVAKYAVGTMGESLKADGHLVVGTVLLTHAAAIQAVETDGLREVSCGYNCDLEMKAGVAPDGTRYDAVQRNIRGNHLAVVDRGRAGAEVRLRLDANDNAVQVDLPADTTKNGGRTMAFKVRIDGYEFDAEEKLGQAIEKTMKLHADELAKAKAEVAQAKKEAEAATARADMAEKAKTKAEEALKAAQDPAKLQAAISARVDLEGKARKVLGAEAKLDGKTDAEIKRAVLAKACPELKLDGKSDDYVATAFDVAVSELKKHADDAGGGGGPVIDRNGRRDDELDERALREKMKKEGREAYRAHEAKK